MNQDYLYLTLKSIIDKCGEYFHVILIDDESFCKLLPDWKVDFVKISDPQKNYIRTLALMKVLYTYGGMQLNLLYII